MPEIIISVKEVSNAFDGFIIRTDLQSIEIGIDNYINCCEQWGYFISEDDISYFIGAELLGVSVVDNALNVLSIEKSSEYENQLSDYEASFMFVNFETNRGLLQFVVYNAHNGYYAHKAFLRSKQLTFTTKL
jgi:hypothetical protein